MSLEQLANLGDLLSGIAVVVSLVYLAIQLRTNTAILKSSSSWDANHTFADLNDLIWQDKEFGELLQRSFSPKFDLSDFDESEKFRLHIFNRSNFQRLESQFFLAKQGLLEPGIWENRKAWNSGVVQLPFWHDWWEVETTGNSIFTREFIDEINSSTPEIVQFLGTS